MQWYHDICRDPWSRLWYMITGRHICDYYAMIITGRLVRAIQLGIQLLRIIIKQIAADSELRTNGMHAIARVWSARGTRCRWSDDSAELLGFLVFCFQGRLCSLVCGQLFNCNCNQTVLEFWASIEYCAKKRRLSSSFHLLKSEWHLVYWSQKLSHSAELTAAPASKLKRLSFEAHRLSVRAQSFCSTSISFPASLCNHRRGS